MGSLGLLPAVIPGGSPPLLSCSVAPIIVPLFLVAAPLKMVFPKKGSLLFQGH